ncbi:hypothetical protein L6452_38132 [Arctium lappa]|uniref:Uncharacterized protein n=1 Tax=Arctium lappa TaxID=4217 RepID=A0ACB8Y617_ARCLA|nr:hypothetical protein L6452_38132 [Arctium lappa]
MVTLLSKLMLLFNFLSVVSILICCWKASQLCFRIIRHLIQLLVLGSRLLFLAMKSTGGKLLVFQSVLPSVGIVALSAREDEGRTNISAGEKVSVDVFITTQSYVDIASISVIPRTTGGQVCYYHPFSALSNPAKLYNDLRWNVTRPQGFEVVMRVRNSQGLQVMGISVSESQQMWTYLLFVSSPYPHFLSI